MLYQDYVFYSKGFGNIKAYNKNMMGKTLSVKVNKNIQIRLHRIIFEFSAYKVETKNFFCLYRFMFF